VVVVEGVVVVISIDKWVAWALCSSNSSSTALIRDLNREEEGRRVGIKVKGRRRTMWWWWW